MTVLVDCSMVVRSLLNVLDIPAPTARDVTAEPDCLSSDVEPT